MERVAADASAAPGDLFPDEDAEFVAEFEDAARLLVVCEADEVHAHVLDELHLLTDEVVGHRGCIAGVVFVAMGAAQEEAFAIELEGAMFDELGVADAEGLVSDVLRV